MTNAFSSASGHPVEFQHPDTSAQEALLNPRTASDRTKKALVEAAIAVFGEKGYAASSTREIAKEASANIAAISYHFGGKEGLRDACAVYVVGMMHRAWVSRLTQITESMPNLTPDQAAEQLETMIELMASFVLLDNKARLIVRFMMRELAAPSSAMDEIYAHVMAPAHSMACTLWATASGWDADEERTKLEVLSIVSQLFYFRMAQDVILRRLDWDRITEPEARKMIDTFKFNLRAAVAKAREEG